MSAPSTSGLSVIKSYCYELSTLNKVYFTLLYYMMLSRRLCPMMCSFTFHFQNSLEARGIYHHGIDSSVVTLKRQNYNDDNKILSAAGVIMISKLFSF